MKTNTIEPGPCVNCGQPKKPSFREFYCDCAPKVRDWVEWEAKFKRVANLYQGAWDRMLSARYFLECAECHYPALFLSRKPVNGEVLRRDQFIEVLNNFHDGTKPVCETCGTLITQRIIAEDVHPNPFHIPF